MASMESDPERQLEAELLQAHTDNNRAALIDLYTQAADLSEASGQIDATCFFLTHAYVFALESDSPQARQLNKQLVTYGREVPLP